MLHTAIAPTAATRPPVLQLANFHRADRLTEPLLRDWLLPHRDSLFRWTMALAADADARHALAEVAVAIQRLRGTGELTAWLFGAALRAAAQQAQRGGLAEASLAGLAPELRAVLRLVARAELRTEEAMALLPQRMGQVRSRLVQTRLVQTQLLQTRLRT